ncbi:MAG: PDZ domain-containing protein [Candidatus Eisenbacteria bacterium]|nr:PDZ domain-containing protein [Candidatus Eisenbacteria bacterium]
MTRPAARIGFGLILALLVAPAPAHAQDSISPAAQEVVERYLKASGGRAAFEAESTLHVKGRVVAAGLKGRFEAWLGYPDRRVTNLTLGSLKRRTGCDGIAAWQTDLSSRKVRRLDGKDLEAALADAWFQCESWARRDQGGGRVTLGSKSFGAEGTLQSLDVTPPVGQSRRLWFGTRTGLLARVRAQRDQHAWDERISEYRRLGGRKRATVNEAGSPDFAASYECTTLDSAWSDVPLAAEFFAPPPSKESPISWLGTPRVARLPIRYIGRHVWVRASLDGAPAADFLLDTGASLTALDERYAAGLGLAREGALLAEGVGGVGGASFAKLRRIRVAGPGGDGVEVHDFKVGIVDLGEGLEEAMWRRPAGLLGSDFISRFVAEIDYDHETLTLRDPQGFAYQGKGAAVPMGLAGGIPTVSLALDEACAGTFLVDVGNGFHLSLHASLARRCRPFRLGRRELEVYGGGIGGGFVSTLCRLDSLRIGPYGWNGPLVAISLHIRGMVGSQDYAGNIGNGVLERFKCTFDYARGRLYLEPGARYGERDHTSRLGAWFVRLQDRVVVADVARGSPAEEAGLEPGDELREIDGKPVRRLAREELKRVLDDGEPGSTLTLTVARELHERQIEVTLADIL